ncbi:MAG: oligosaccharide flippase family protein [Colwellia sp.]|nr:oligosaccharide flippase family protein [Colwellia sp.]
MINKVINLVQVLFSKKKICNTDQERAVERARKIAQSSAVGLVSRLTNVLSGLITVPLTLPYLGIEQFGIWMALTGFIAFLSFTDLGISIGLQTALSKCDGEDDKVKPSSYISSAMALILIIVLLLIVFTCFLLPLLDVTYLIKLEKTDTELLLITTQVLILTFAFGLPAGLVQRVFEAYQYGVYSNSLLIIGRVFSLISVFVSIELGFGLPIMLMLYMGLPFAVLILGGGYLFYTRKWLRPNVLKIKSKFIKEILSVGALALFAQLGSSIMTTGPLLILSSNYGAAAIVPFALTQRLLGVVSILLSAVLGPLWPAYTEAKARGDILWIKKTFYKSILFSIVAVIPFFIFFTVAGQWLIEIWSGDSLVVPSFSLLMVCNVWMVIFAGIRALSMFLNGIGQFKGQAIYGLLLPIIAVFIGGSLPLDYGITLCLAVMIFTGDTGRLIAQGIESRVHLKRLAI